MKRAVITTGGKQYVVAQDDELDVELLNPQDKIEFEPLLVFDDKDVMVGQPTVSGVKVKASLVEGQIKGPKVRVMKFKAKKRVKKVTGHRQKYSRIKITAITTK